MAFVNRNCHRNVTLLTVKSQMTASLSQRNKTVALQKFQ